MQNARITLLEHSAYAKHSCWSYRDSHYIPHVSSSDPTFLDLRGRMQRSFIPFRHGWSQLVLTACTTINTIFIVFMQVTTTIFLSTGLLHDTINPDLINDLNRSRENENLSEMESDTVLSTVTGSWMILGSIRRDERRPSGVDMCTLCRAKRDIIHGLECEKWSSGVRGRILIFASSEDAARRACRWGIIA